MADDHGLEECAECGSSFRAAVSAMAGLCPECAYWLYGYPNCPHDMADGRCRHCAWTGATTPYIEGLKRAAEQD
jgi:hypothetical protein